MSYYQSPLLPSAYVRIEVETDSVDGVSIRLDSAAARHLVLGENAVAYDGLTVAEASDVLCAVVEAWAASHLELEE